MDEEEKEMDEGGLKMDSEDELDLPPEGMGMTDFGLDEEDPDRDR